MGFQFISKINSCILLDIISEYILCKRQLNETQIHFYNQKLEKIWTYTVEKQSFRYLQCSDELSIIFDNKKSKFINLKTGIIKTIEDRLYLKKNDFISIFIDVSEKEYINVAIGDVKNKIPSNKSIKYILKNVIVEKLYNSAILNSYSLQTGKKLWEKNISKIYKSESINILGDLISYNKYIIGVLFNQLENISVTLVIDSETGSIVKEINSLGGILKVYSNKIFCLYEKEISILNPENFEITKIDLKEELSILDIQIEEFVATGESIGMSTRYFNFAPDVYAVENNMLFFAQERGSQVGAIDLGTKKLVWYTNIEVGNQVNPTIRDIKAGGNRLYVLDQADTLHIYEYKID